MNDVAGGDDYTGFSLLEEDFLGDLFGSSGNKKKPTKQRNHKNKQKKKQAPAPTTTTTTTKRPRPSRRPSRRTTTTVRPTRTTTVKIRPGNRRPTRRPTRRPANGARPTRRPVPIASVEQNEIISSSVFSSPTTPSTFANIPVTTKIQAMPEADDTESDTFEAIIGTRQPSTTVKAVTNFNDPGLEMSVAHITDQLASMPVMSINNNEPKDSGMVTKPKEEMSFQKIETLTPKAPLAKTSTENPLYDINDDMIQIVTSLDSVEDVISSTEKEEMAVEESRAHFLSHAVSGEVLNNAFKVPKKKQRGNIGLDDLDVLDLTEIGETIGDQLGIFGGKNRPTRENNKDTKLDYSDYEEVVDTMGDALLMVRNASGKKQKKNRGRQNKMMRGDWSH